MSVERILAGKGRDVIFIDPQSTLAEAARMLNHHGIGALVVIDASRRWSASCPSATSCGPWPRVGRRR